MKDQRFRVHVLLGQGAQMVDQELHLVVDYTVQLVITSGEGSGERVRS